MIKFLSRTTLLKYANKHVQLSIIFFYFLIFLFFYFFNMLKDILKPGK